MDQTLDSNIVSPDSNRENHENSELVARYRFCIRINILNVDRPQKRAVFNLRLLKICIQRCFFPLAYVYFSLLRWPSKASFLLNNKVRLELEINI